MAKSSSLLSLLADDIKLSLLERQRSVSLGLESDAQNGNIARSLESMREGIEGLEAEAARLEGKGDSSAEATRSDAKRLHARYEDLTSQFHGITTPQQTPTTGAFTPAAPPTPSITSPPLSNNTSRAKTASPPTKAVRFRDSSPDPEEAATRAALFPYRDDPRALEEGPPDQSNLSNTQIHAYHDQVMAEQDEQLDRLGDSIGRQRELGMRIGDELDEHVAMLDDVDRHVDRQQGRINRTRERIGKIARKANDNRQITTIVVLIVILLLLIVVLKT